MIEMIEAVQFARQVANQLFQDEQIEHLGLEEILFDEDSLEWLVTLGYDSHRVKKVKVKPTEFIYRYLDDEAIVEISLHTKGMKEIHPLREYKTFLIDAIDGTFNGMLIDNCS